MPLETCLTFDTLRQAQVLNIKMSADRRRRNEGRRLRPSRWCPCCLLLSWVLLVFRLNLECRAHEVYAYAPQQIIVVAVLAFAHLIAGIYSVVIRRPPIHYKFLEWKERKQKQEETT